MTMKKILIILLFLQNSFSVFASEENIERIVTTATRTDESVKVIPYSVSTIDNDTLSTLSPTHIEEVLRTVAGANFHRGNGQEYLPALRSPVFSGAGACGGILTLENGVPIRAPGFCNINELFEANTEIAESIEILKGPGSAHYGSNAIHGVINVITPSPQVNNNYLALDLGSYGYKRAKWLTATKAGNGDLGLGVSVTRDSGYRDEESVDMEKLNLRYDTSLGNWDVESALTWINLEQETAGFVEGFEAYRDEDLSQRNANPEAFRDARALRIHSRFSRPIGNNQHLILTPYFRDQSMTFRLHFLPGIPLEENSQIGIGLQSQYINDVSENVSVRFGVDTDYTKGALRQEQFDATPGSAFLQETVPIGLQYDYEVNALVIAPYVQLEWRYSKGSVQLGVRSEYTSYDYNNLTLTGRTRDDGSECGFGGCRYSRPADSRDTFTTTSPKLGATYQLLNNLQLFGNIAFGHRAPQATELYRLQRDQIVADLDSETAKSIEVGLRYSGQSSFVQASAYAIDKDNVIFRDSDFFTISDGATRHKGVELEGQWDIYDSLRLSVAGTYAIHEYSNDRFSGGININNNAIDTAPRWVGNARLDWQLASKLNTNIELHWVSRYYTDAENQNDYEGHELVNWRLSWHVTSQLSLVSSVVNVFDRRYAERADFTSFTADRFFPGKPRTYWLMVKYSY